MNKQRRVSVVIGALVMSLAVGQAVAQYQMRRYTINSGGGQMSGGSYLMRSSIAQVDASNEQSGGSYSLHGGFWRHLAAAPQGELMFRDGFE